MKTSIIIPTYNGKRLLVECIESIRAHTREDFELIVVDNGSTDGTIDWCRSERITFISSGSNLGFPKACNLGLRIATGEALLLLNNDVIVTANWLENMLQCLFSSGDIGIVGPTTNYVSGRQKIAVDYDGIGQMHIMAAQYNIQNSAKWENVNRLVGFCYLFKRDLMNAIGLLDERFSPGHYEDDDYCYRARAAGFRLMIAADVFVHHHGSASFHLTEQQELERLVALNKYKFMQKWGIDPQIFM